MRRLPTAVGVAATLLVAGCGGAESSSPADYGPLAVVDVDGGDSARLGTGRLEIGDRCVTLREEESGQLFTVAWNNSQVTWSEADAAIIFDHEGRAVTLRSGDRISAGGSEISATSSFFVVAPNNSCPPRVFVATQIRPE